MGRVVALVTLDAAAVERSFTDEVRARLAQSIEIPADQVLVNVSHSHSAPVTRRWPVFGPEYADPFPAYMDQLTTAAVGAVEDAFNGRQPAQLLFGRGTALVGANRHTDNGPMDPTLDVLVAKAENTGEPLAIALFHACHPITHLNVDLSTISADFPGVVRAGLEQANSGAVAMFFQGFAGTINPAGGVDVGTTLADRVNEILEGPLTELSGQIRVVARSVDLSMCPPPTADRLIDLTDTLSADDDVVSEAQKRWTGLMSAIASPQLTMPTDLVTVTIGEGENAWRLVASAHEVVAEWSDLVRAMWPDELVTLMAYTGMVDCYLPTAAILRETPAEDFPLAENYEGCSSFMFYGLSATLATTVDVEYLRGVDTVDSHRRSTGRWSILGPSLHPMAFVTPSPGGVGVCQWTADGDPEWKWLGGDVSGRVTAICASNRAVNVFGRGPDADLFHAAQTGPDLAWSDWASVGGPIAGDPAVVSLLSGCLVVVARDPDGNLIWLREEAPQGAWRAPASLGVVAAGDPEVVRLPGGDLMALARGPANELVMQRYSVDADTWQSEDPPANSAAVGDPAAVVDSDGNLIIAVPGDGGVVKVAAIDRAAAAADWFILNASVDGPISVASTPAGDILVLGHSAASELVFNIRASGQQEWAGWSTFAGAVASVPAGVVLNDGSLLAITLDANLDLSAVPVPVPDGGAWTALGCAPVP
jgi:hypothetical protein